MLKNLATKKSAKQLCLLVILCVVGLNVTVYPDVSLAQGAKPTRPSDARVPKVQQVDTGWVVNCTSKTAAESLVCQVSQDITIKDTGQRLVSVILRQGDDRQGLSMLLALPHGIFFPAGVDLKIDDSKPQKVAMQTSDPRGSYAAFNVNAAFLAALKAGNRLTIGLENVQRKPISIDVSLSGFTAAIGKLLETR